MQDRFLTMMSQLRKALREPVSALTHFIAGFLSLLGAAVLLILTRHHPGKMLSLFVYGTTLIALFAASTLLHALKVGEAAQKWLNRIDHMAIFLLIAGTYTPIVYNFLSPAARWPILIVVWLIAFAGMAFKLMGRRIDQFFNVFIYVLLSWGGAVLLLPGLQYTPVLTQGGWVLLLIGGLIYSAGFVIYYTRRPDPWPRVFGHHEIWHLCVIGGSLCHYVFMLQYVVPAAPFSS